MFNDIITIIMLLSVLGVLYCINTTLGIVLKTKGQKFNFIAFRKGLVKAIVIAICMVGFCFCLESMPIILSRIGIVIDETFITVLEVLGVMITAYKKYVSDCYEKVKQLFNIE